MLFEGQIVGGVYRLDERLHQGGACDVWAATETSTRRRVALKILAEDLAAQSSYVSLFIQRGRMAARGLHASFVTVETIGRTDHGVPFLVLPLLQGTTLRRMIDADGPLAAERACAILGQTLEGLAEAHHLGSPHGNLSPSNLFITASSEPGPSLRILNFGLSRAMLAEPDAHTPDRVLGPLDYLPPELLQRPGAPPTPAADVFACGVIATEMLAGQPPLAPLRPDDPAIESKLADRNGYYLSGRSIPPPSTSIRSLSPALDAVLRKAMASAPGDRYADAAQMLEAFRGATAGGAALLVAAPARNERAAPPSDTLQQTHSPSTQLYVLDDGRPSIDTDVDGPDHRDDAPGLDSDTTGRDTDDLGLDDVPSLTTDVMSLQSVSLPELSGDYEGEDTVQSAFLDDLESTTGPAREDFADPFESAAAPGATGPRDLFVAGDSQDTTDPFVANSDPVEAPPPGYAKTVLFDMDAAARAAPKPREATASAPQDPTPTTELPADPTAIFVPPPGDAPSSPEPPSAAEPAPGIGAAKTMLLEPDAGLGTTAKTQILEPGSLSPPSPLPTSHSPAARSVPGPASSAYQPSAPAQDLSAPGTHAAGAAQTSAPVAGPAQDLSAPGTHAAGAAQTSAPVAQPAQAALSLTGRADWSPTAAAAPPKRRWWLLVLLLGFGAFVLLALLAAGALLLLR